MQPKYFSVYPKPIKHLDHKEQLDHLPQQYINLVLPAAKITTINEMVVLLAPATVWRVELEVPQEVCCLLEVGANSVDLMNQVLHTDDAVFA
jgi:hypothetical protein